MTYGAMAARRASPGKKAAGAAAQGASAPLRWALRWLARLVLGGAAAYVALIVAYTVVNPPITLTIWSEMRRLGSVDQQWTPMDEIAPVVARSVVAAEDANFCRHWGFDMKAIRQAIDAGGDRGASTISQQTVKNVFLWQGRSWLRKGLEAWYTVLIEAMWPKTRILEVYVNVAEFGDGIYGAQAAARSYWDRDASRLTAEQSARLAAVLPAPRRYSAVRPGPYVQRRAAWIQRQMRQLGGREHLDELD